MSKQDAGNAERAAEWYAREVLGCVKTVRAVRTRFQRQDLFGSDCLGKKPNGALVAIQVTTGDSANVAHRRRKIEDIPWCLNDTPILLEMRRQQDGRRVRHFFRPHFLVVSANPMWLVGDQVPVPREWFRAWRPME